MHYDILSGMTCFPVAGILILIAWRNLDEEWDFRVALTASLTPWAFLVRILSLYRTAPGGIQFANRSAWLPQFLGEVHTGLDGFSIGLLIAGLLVVPLAIRTEWQSRDRDRGRPIRRRLRLILLAETALCGALTTLNLLHAFAFWEVLIISVFLLLERPQDERTNLAARQFLWQAVAGSIVLLAGLQLLQAATDSWDQTVLARMAHQVDGAGAPSVLVIRLQELAIRLNLTHFAPGAPTLTFALLAGGLLIQVPVWPFHGWLPTAASRSSPSAVILLLGILLPMSLYLLARMVLPLFGDQVAAHHGVLLALACLTAATSSLAAGAQENLRKSAAYVSLLGAGIGLVGMVAATLPGVAANDRALALNGALLLLFAQGLGLAGLLHLAGRAEEPRCRRAGLLLLAILGLPGFAGFAGLLMVCRGSLLAATDATVVILAALALASAPLFRLAARFLSTAPGQTRGQISRTGSATGAACAVIIATLLGLGIFPNGLVALTNATVTKFLSGQ